MDYKEHKRLKRLKVYKGEGMMKMAKDAAKIYYYQPLTYKLLEQCINKMIENDRNSSSKRNKNR